MKYCVKCGKELCDEAVVCTGCGCMTGQKNNSLLPRKKANTEEKVLGVKILNFIINVFFSVIVLTILTSLFNNEVVIYLKDDYHSRGYCWMDYNSLITGIVFSSVNIILILISFGIDFNETKGNKLDVFFEYCSKLVLALCFLLPMFLFVIL